MNSSLENKNKIKIEISEETVEDVEAVQEVFRVTWIDTYPNEEAGVSREDVEDFVAKRVTPEFIQRLKEYIPKYGPKENCFVAKVDGKVVGFCYAKVLEDRNYLQAIYVLPEFQGKGVGYSLWERVKEFFDPSKDVYLELATYNDKAKAFYERLGFVDTGRRMTYEWTKMKSGGNIPQMEMVMRKTQSIIMF
jgi:GNAT superfamily N-acetyltransferase